MSGSQGHMRILFAFLVMVGVSCLAAGAGNAGIDVRPDLETTPFSSVTHTTPSVDLSPWDLSFTLDDDAVQNATNVTLMVQMCINSGVCYPPEVTPLTTEDNRTFSARITTLDDHSYVHWRVNIEEGNTSTDYPTGSWYSSWSECYYDLDAGALDGPNCSGSSDEGFLPSASMVLVTVMMTLAAVAHRPRH